MLNQVVEVLSKNGIVSIITYHSIEDRLVKRFFKNSCFDNEPKKDHYGNKILSLKPKYNFITPSKSELKLNNRSRSAKLRSAIRSQIREVMLDSILEEGDDIDLNYGSDWVYGNNKPTKSKKGQIARGGFSIGFE